VRAEPVAALYQQGRVHHIGTFPQLEDQMTNFTSDIDRAAAGYSPDRVDALVWAFSELLVEPMKGEGIFELYRRYAEAAEPRDKPQPTKPCTPPARWNGVPSRRNRAEPQCRLRRRLPFAATSGGGPTTKLAVAGGPRVRIHLPPAASHQRTPRQSHRQGRGDSASGGGTVALCERCGEEIAVANDLRSGQRR